VKGESIVPGSVMHGPDNNYSPFVVHNYYTSTVVDTQLEHRHYRTSAAPEDSLRSSSHAAPVSLSASLHTAIDAELFARSPTYCQRKYDCESSTDLSSFDFYPHMPIGKVWISVTGGGVA